LGSRSETDTVRPGGSLAEEEWLCYSLKVAKQELTDTKESTCKQRVDVLLFESRKQRNRKRTRFAIEERLCYSLKVADEQWSLPVAFWPAP